MAVIPVYPTSSSLVNFPINVDRGSLGLDKDTLNLWSNECTVVDSILVPSLALIRPWLLTSLMIVKTGMKYQQVI